MSSTQQASNAASNVGQTGLYGAERTKQEASGAAGTAKLTATEYKNQAIDTYDGLTSSGQEKLASVQNQMSEAANNFQSKAAAKVDEAVAQGQNDVEQTKAASATYVDQAKALAGTALGAAQNALHQGAAMVAPADPAASGILNTIQATTANALETTGGYLGSAQAAITAGVPQETRQRVVENLDNARVNTIESATTAAATVKSALYEPSQTATNAQAAAQPHIDAARQTASDLATSASTTAAITGNAASIQAQDAKAGVSNYGQAAAKAAQDIATQAQGTTASYTESAKQAAQPHVDRAKEMMRSKQGPDTPTGLPAEGIEGVLKYGEDKSASAKQAELRGEYPKVSAY